METRRTNQFLRVALGSRSPARTKLFKGKFHESAAYESRLPLTGTQKRQIQTSYNAKRDGGAFAAIEGGPAGGRAQTTTGEGSKRFGS